MIGGLHRAALKADYKVGRSVGGIMTDWGYRVGFVPSPSRFAAEFVGPYVAGRLCGVSWPPLLLATSMDLPPTACIHSGPAAAAATVKINGAAVTARKRRDFHPVSHTARLRTSGSDVTHQCRRRRGRIVRMSDTFWCALTSQFGDRQQLKHTVAFYSHIGLLTTFDVVICHLWRAFCTSY